MADSSNLSPVKVSHNGAFRRFLIARPATWLDFESKLRGVYNLAQTTSLDVQYKDEEGDVITLNTDSELEDVLSMHFLFSQMAPVRFELFVREDQNASNHTVTQDPAQPLNTWNLGHHDSTSQSNRSITVTSLHSEDDGSLIDFEETAETVLEQNAPYYHPDSETITLRNEQDMAEADKLDAPFFSSSILGAPQSTPDNRKQEMDTDIESEGNKTADSVVTALLIDTTSQAPASPTSNNSRRSSNIGSPVVPLIEFEALRMENAPEVMDSILASAMEQHAEEVAEAVRRSESGDEAADPIELEAGNVEGEQTPQTPIDNEPALIQQFQMLIQEFQHVIENNPQLVALAGSIMNKILSHVKVNVESFATYLQEAANQAAASASTEAQDTQASRSCPFGSGDNFPFGNHGQPGHFGHPWGGRGGFFGRRGPWGQFGQHARHHHSFPGSEDPFSGAAADGCSSDEDPASKEHPEHVQHSWGHGWGHGWGHPSRGGPRRRGGRGGCGPGGRGGGLFGWTMPPMPPMPPTPFTPGMMPGMMPDGSRVPCKQPSPFMKGFPFHTAEPSTCRKSSHFKFRRSCRPTAGDTESKQQEKELNPSGEGPSGMPGSFPDQPPMSETNAGWTWTHLGDDNAEGSSTSRPRFGWVWNGVAGAETAEPTPLYSATSDDEMADASLPHPPPPPHAHSHPFNSGPPGGRGGFGPFRGRGGSRSSHPFHAHAPPHAQAWSHSQHHHQHHDGHGHAHVHGHGHRHGHGHGHGHAQHRRHSGSRSGGERDVEKDKDGSVTEEKLKRRQTFHEQRSAMLQSRKEALQEQRQAIAHQREVQEEQRRVLEEQRVVQEQQRIAQDEQHRAQEQQRRENRVSQLVDRSRPVGGGSLAGIWPSASSTSAAASADATPTSANAAPTSADATPTSATARPTSASAVPRTAAPVLNPFADPDEFAEQIRAIVEMGFQDNAELHQVVKDFGGEVDAIVEHLISQQR
ncbi:hypothetical protein BG004_007837 [Podila humilis]|nr:hypothetical protein BG004_007837 [Podila humilis]